ncbi:unnamed protein product [Oikopleura dioica]|uniref:Uncharacterized protein n=1 Tax=Oikopleura dioica TaxID=34765 RepID=E4X0M1_OIKDI|nr:unnamed protein product [Oikopleura dioica]
MYTTSHTREFQPAQGRRNAPLRPSTTEFAAQRPFKEKRQNKTFFEIF